MNRDLIVFIGESGAGKDYLLNNCIKEFGWHKTVSHTTRPMRDGEIDEKDYHFISESEFCTIELNRKFIETTSYKTQNGEWYYGFHEDSIEGDGIKGLILNKHGLDQFIERGYGDRMIIFQVYCDTDIRILRYKDRLGYNPTEKQLAEGFLRLLRDIEDFKQFEDGIYNTPERWANEYKGVPIELVINESDKAIEFLFNEIKSFMGLTNER